MRVTVLAGGVGSARLLTGLVRVVDPSRLTAVVNVGDDERVRGLHISPDIDTVLYHLAGLTDWDRGWGLREETLAVHTRYTQLAASLEGCGVDLQDWFTLGDGDLATHLLRARLLDAGLSLSQATGHLCRAMGVAARVLPATDDRLRTVLVSEQGDSLDFQEYFVRLGQTPDVAGVRFTGADQASPAPGVLESMNDAGLLVIPPSNPLISVAPILAVSRIREKLESAKVPRVAVSPIVAGRAIKGPAARLLAQLGHEPTAVGVARMYQGLIDVFVLDEADRESAGDITALGMRPVVCDTIMRGPDDAAGLARRMLEAVEDAWRSESFR